MGRVGRVVSASRVDDDNTGYGLDVVVDPGGEDRTVVPHFADPGDDSQPLPGDDAALEESSGTGAEHATGYADTRNAGKASPGEKRIYARKPDGSTACDVWLKGDETIEISFGAGGSIECKANGDVEINGVVITKLGAIKAPGEVTATGALGPVSLTTHMHPTAATGPASSPTPDAGP